MNSLPFAAIARLNPCRTVRPARIAGRGGMPRTTVREAAANWALGRLCHYCELARRGNTSRGSQNTSAVRSSHDDNWRRPL